MHAACVIGCYFVVLGLLALLAPEVSCSQGFHRTAFNTVPLRQRTGLPLPPTAPPLPLPPPDPLRPGVGLRSPVARRTFGGGPWPASGTPAWFPLWALTLPALALLALPAAALVGLAGLVWQRPTTGFGTVAAPYIAIQAVTSRTGGDPSSKSTRVIRPWEVDYDGEDAEEVYRPPPPRGQSPPKGARAVRTRKADLEDEQDEDSAPSRRVRTPMPWDEGPDGEQRRYPSRRETTVPPSERGGKGRGRGKGKGKGSMNNSDNEGPKWYPPTEPRPPREEGVDYLYGVTPVLSALRTKRRTALCLYLQDTLADAEDRGTARKDQGAVGEIEALARDLALAVEVTNKGELNNLTDNRPHQGVVLKTKPLEFVPLKELPAPPSPSACWLALDELTDPQNLGALLRSAYFLKATGVVVSAKNSAPLSATVSKASASAMEVMEVHSTPSMMRLLACAPAKGWRVVGATLSPQAVTLPQLPTGVPTVVVLGNEGHGLRTNILRACTALVRLGPPRRRGDAVDSLNVSVAGGILLHHLLANGASAPDSLTPPADDKAALDAAELEPDTGDV